MIKLRPLTPQEMAVEKVLDDAGLLNDMKEEYFHKHNNILLLCCSDGRHFIRSVVNPFMEICTETNALQLHPLPRHGGTLVLDEGSPLVPPGHTTDKDLIREFREAVEGGYKEACFVNHFPCSKARMHKVHPLEIVDSLVRAKKRIKEKEGISDITIACFLQITDGPRTRLARIPHIEYLRWRTNTVNSIEKTLLETAHSFV